MNSSFIGRFKPLLVKPIVQASNYDLTSAFRSANFISKPAVFGKICLKISWSLHRKTVHFTVLLLVEMQSCPLLVGEAEIMK
jgi:hypothetical protein